jgi:hypothetical protein
MKTFSSRVPGPDNPLDISNEEEWCDRAQECAVHEYGKEVTEREQLQKLADASVPPREPRRPDLLDQFFNPGFETHEDIILLPAIRPHELLGDIA